ncbi:dephospho-CoA kinase [Echinicola pacifica]|uniref:Dephospho-CoA kinase n=1 Tax=Echinicola pacifica TaxID=346377 RepID=A0A918Q794_9BACT|nr:dephospho-CoA kinase [Echinicola pacifica]GGZ34233.1 dephospho-CoA kinase [Echinicola pacifica]
MNKSLLIGITGGIGAGKSTVARVFALLGIPIYYADDRAKWLMGNAPELKQQIIAAFGEESYLPEGSLNRSFLAEQVFSNPEKTTVINGLVHPAVKADFESWAEKQDSPYVLKEAALLVETGAYKDLDKLITVTAPQEVRISRVLQRDPQRSREQVLSIMDKQSSDSKKNKLADFIVTNTEDRLLIPQVLRIHEQLSS